MNKVDLSKFQRTFKASSGSQYRINILKGGVGIGLFLKLKNIVLPLFGGVLDGMSNDDVVLDKTTTYTDIALVLCEQMDKADIISVIETLLNGCTVKTPEDAHSVPKDLNFDEHFMANYGDLLELLSFALQENFGSLFTSKGILPQLTTAMGAIKAST